MQRSAKLGLIVIGVLLAFAGAAGAQTVVSFWHTYSEEETAFLEGVLIPQFEAANPGVRVESVRIDYGEFRARLVSASAAGAGPDVARIDIIWSPELAAAGLLEPLSRYPGFDALLASVYPGPLSTNFYRGEYYGLPLTTNTQVYIYNEQIFQEMGIAAPRTTSEFEDVTRRLTRREADAVLRYGYDMGGPWNWYLLPWIWSNGGALTDPAITTARGYLDGEATVAIVERIADWANEGILAPNMLLQGFDSWGSFVNGALAARQDGPWFANWLEANHPNVDAGYALMPHEAGLDSISVVGGENIALLRSSGQKEAAWTFARFMLSAETQAQFAAVGQIPVVMSAASADVLAGSKYYPVYLEQLLTAQARTPHPGYQRLEEIAQDAFVKAITGQVTPRAALEEAARLIDEAVLQAAE